MSGRSCSTEFCGGAAGAWVDEFGDVSSKLLSASWAGHPPEPSRSRYRRDASHSRDRHFAGAIMKLRLGPEDCFRISLSSGLRIAVATCGRRAEEARKAAARLLRVDPAFRVSKLKNSLGHIRHKRFRNTKSVRAAGWSRRPLRHALGVHPGCHVCPSSLAAVCARRHPVAPHLSYRSLIPLDSDDYLRSIERLMRSF